MDYRTALAKVRGLGAAHHGTQTWWMQRITAVLLTGLSFWLVVYCKQLVTVSYEEMLFWLAQPMQRFCAISWIVVAFYHAALGLTVVIEDYVQAAVVKISFIWIINVLFCGLGLLSLIAIFNI